MFPENVKIALNTIYIKELVAIPSVQVNVNIRICLQSLWKY